MHRLLGTRSERQRRQTAFGQQSFHQHIDPIAIGGKQLPRYTVSAIDFHKPLQVCLIVTVTAVFVFHLPQDNVATILDRARTQQRK